MWNTNRETPVQDIGYLVNTQRPVSDKDPTRTFTLRNKFIAAVNRKLRRLKRDIRKAIIELDIFGINQQPPFALADSLMPKKFAFVSNPQKISGFQEWLKDQHNKGLLEITQAPTGGLEPWSNIYIRSSYQRGLSEARRRLLAKGVTTLLPPVDDLFGGVAAAFNAPMHADRVALIYTRSFDGLTGITQAMDTQMSRILAGGLAEGVGAYEMARRLNDRVDKIGITRARLLARTEVTHAYNEAQLMEYDRSSEIIGEPILSEWWTAGDERVRSSHEVRHGVVYKRKDVEPLIGEPNCRCTLLPYIPSVDGVVTKSKRR